MLKTPYEYTGDRLFPRTDYVLKWKPGWTWPKEVTRVLSFESAVTLNLDAAHYMTRLLKSHRVNTRLLAAPLGNIDGPKYARDINTIYIPALEYFIHPDQWLQALCHEITHSMTGKRWHDVFDPVYAEQELIAEIAAGYITRNFSNRPTLVDHEVTQYCAIWSTAVAEEHQSLSDFVDHIAAEVEIVYQQFSHAAQLVFVEPDPKGK